MDLVDVFKCTCTAFSNLLVRDTIRQFLSYGIPFKEIVLYCCFR